MQPVHNASRISNAETLAAHFLARPEFSVRKMKDADYTNKFPDKNHYFLTSRVTKFDEEFISTSLDDWNSLSCSQNRKKDVFTSNMSRCT